ncbi:HXXEE domain-containing protein [Streptococcus anginosus]|uniref:HXXEE domain-containing protein n=1 Tax=Streptococcus anginosus TaxID=1328 RepID=UPI00189A12D7|nr:HXXEE domain-containing protein [Streptococcus anginosus]MDB8657890.1 HXXEE domain-containing protein [Streptococcus anginosus]
MKDTIWLFPLLFIFHDLEEIIGFMPWIERNEKLLAKKAVFILNTHKGLSTEGFALAVAEEFVVVLLVSFFALICHTRLLYLIWLGGFVAFALHLVVHILQAIWLRRYIPALATSILCLPVISNLFFALWLGRQFSGWLNKIFYNSEKIEKL